MNNHLTTCYYRTSDDKFKNHVFKWNDENKDITKKRYAKADAFIEINNENKLMFYNS